jgi:hypothetical protein
MKSAILSFDVGKLHAVEETLHTAKKGNDEIKLHFAYLYKYYIKELTLPFILLLFT